jgi:acetoacetate decarboxylase
MVSFVKSIEDIMKNGGKPTVFYDAEILTMYWETKPEIIARILPAPLQPAKKPLVHAFIANYPRTNFCPPYSEAGLFILADYEGELGTYCLSMPITDDIGMALGREICGLPKKMAKIDFKKDGDNLQGTISRHGIEFFNVKAEINGKFNAEGGEDTINSFYGSGLPMYNIKYSKAIDGSGFDLMPTLVKQGLGSEISFSKAAEVSAVFAESPHDPWSELEIVRMLGAVYTVGTNTLLKGSVLTTINPGTYIPYSLQKWDWWENNL